MQKKHLVLRSALAFVSVHHPRPQVLAGLPVVFVQGRAAGWGKISCDAMIQHAHQVAHRLSQGLKPGGKPPFNYHKLKSMYWIRFIHDKVWQAEAEIRGVGDEGEGGLDDGSEELNLYPEMFVGRG